MSKNPKAGRAVRKLNRAKTPGEALAVLGKLDQKTKDQLKK